MAKKKDIIREIPDSEIELFGAHKTKKEIKADEKARKAKERAALKEAIAARRQEAKSGHPAAKEMMPVFIVTGIVVALCVLLLVLQFTRADEAKEWSRNESLGHFTDVEVAPTLEEKKINAHLVEAYYTNNGHLYLRMILSNGDKSPVQLTQLDVNLWNGEESHIGGGIIQVEDETIPAEGTIQYACYIAPEHLTLKDDTLSTLKYQIKATGTILSGNDSTTE